MDGQIKTWLHDIPTSVDDIDSFFEGGPRRFADYRGDVRTRSAVERKIEIIGEAMNRILRADPDFQITHARRIVDTRNRIAHGYDSVSDETMWGIVINHLPQLRAEIEKLIAQA